MDIEKPDLAKIRRLSLSVAAVLITFCIAGVELDVPARISPMGIPLIIKKPDLLSVGLVIALVYSTLRYIYYGMLVNRTPWNARRQLLLGKLVHTPRVDMSPQDYSAMFTKEMARYFPQVGKKTARIDELMIYQSDNDSSAKIFVPTIVKAFCWLEDIDFLLPVLASVAAILLLLFY